MPKPSQWKGAPAPRPQEMRGIDTDAAVKAGAVVVGTAATGYIIYRVIRFLPSPLPPLWPTIPANLAIP